jgi:hypothetical protein
MRKETIRKKILQKYPECLFGQSFNDGHLGGCNEAGCPEVETPKLWNYLIKKYNIRSVLDIGCGFGYALKYFNEILNLEIYGIDGSEKIRDVSFYPDKILTNDYSKGPSIFNTKIDLVWSTEFLEHVEAAYIPNFMKDICLSKYCVVTHAPPNQLGHHHVNCQTKEYWIEEFKKYGMIYDEEETQIIKTLAMEDHQDLLNYLKLDPVNREFRTFSTDECDTQEFNSTRIPCVGLNALFFKK